MNTRRFVIPPEVVARRVVDETVILHVESGQYFSLNAVGSTIWEQVATGKSEEEIESHLKAVYEENPDVLRADLLRLLSELLEHGLLQLALTPIV